MRTERRLLTHMKPYRGLFFLGLATNLFASLLDGFTIVVLIPLLKRLFGTAGALGGSTRLEQFSEWFLRPFLAGASAGEATARIVIILLVGLLFKNGMSYASSQINSAMQEGPVPITIRNKARNGIAEGSIVAASAAQTPDSVSSSGPVHPRSEWMVIWMRHAAEARINVAAGTWGFSTVA
jgi:hypothetical protein